MKRRSLLKALLALPAALFAKPLASALTAEREFEKLLQGLPRDLKAPPPVDALNACEDPATGNRTWRSRYREDRIYMIEFGGHSRLATEEERMRHESWEKFTKLARENAQRIDASRRAHEHEQTRILEDTLGRTHRSASARRCAEAT